MSIVFILFVLIGIFLGYLLGEAVGYEKGFDRCDEIDKELIEVLKNENQRITQ